VATGAPDPTVLHPVAGQHRVGLRIPPFGTVTRAESPPCPRAAAGIISGPWPQRETRR